MKFDETNMANNDVNYQALTNEPTNPFADQSSQKQQQQNEAIGIDEMATDTETEDNRDPDIMIHVVPDTSKGKACVVWFAFSDSHTSIRDLACFFSRKCQLLSMFRDISFKYFTNSPIFVGLSSTIAQWNHIEDLDSFFTRMYNYHQKHGFNVMMVNYVMDLVIFAFVVYFVTVVFFCVDYKVLDGWVASTDFVANFHEFRDFYSFSLLLL